MNEFLIEKMKEFKSDDPVRSREAVYALGNSSISAPAIPILLETLEATTDPEMLGALTYAVREIELRHQAAEPPYRKMLESRNGETVRRAIKCLNWIGTDELLAVPHILRYIDNCFESMPDYYLIFMGLPQTATHYGCTLSLAEVTTGLDELHRAGSGIDPVDAQAFQLVSDWVNGEAPKLNPDDSVNRKVLKVIACLWRPDRNALIPPLIVDEPSEIIRAAIAVGLHLLDHPSLELARSLLGDPSSTVRTEAIQSLLCGRPNHRFKGLEDEVIALLDDPCPDVQMSATRACTELDVKRDQATTRLIQLFFEAENIDVKEDAASDLYEMFVKTSDPKLLPNIDKETNHRFLDFALGSPLRNTWIMYNLTAMLLYSPYLKNNPSNIVDSIEYIKTHRNAVDIFSDEIDRILEELTRLIP